MQSCWSVADTAVVLLTGLATRMESMNALTNPPYHEVHDEILAIAAALKVFIPVDDSPKATGIPWQGAAR